MKKLLSALLCAAMLISGMAIGTSAGEIVDKAILFDDLSLADVGKLGYSANTQEYTKDADGLTFAFDFNAIQGVPCGHQFDKPEFKHMSGMFITWGGNFSGLEYDFTAKEFRIVSAGWMPSGQNFSTNDWIRASVHYECKPGEWHRIAINVWDVDITVYVDGEIILEYSFNGGANGDTGHDYLIWYGQHAQFAIDNITVANPDPSVYDPANEDFSSEAIYDFDDCNDAVMPVVKELKEEQTIDPATGEGKVDDNGNPITHTVFSTVDDAKLIICNFDMFELMNLFAYSVIDRNTSFTAVTETEDANITFADIPSAKKGSEIEVEVTVNGVSDKRVEVPLANDSRLTFKELRNVPSAATISGAFGATVEEGILIMNNMPDGSSFKAVYTISEDAVQDVSYRYGVVPTDDVTVNGGQVTVVNFKYGDVNEDSKVNGKDVAAMLKYKAGFEVVFNAEAADVYSDGKFTARDITYLIRHLANWEGYENVPSSAS